MYRYFLSLKELCEYSLKLLLFGILISVSLEQKAIAQSIDYGDAPPDYGDASHNFTAAPDLYLGAIAPDSEDDTLASGSGSAGDDNTGTDDEDAFVALPNVPLVDPNVTGLSLGRKYNLTVPVTNNSGSNAVLYAWIDFDRNGKFEANEYQTATIQAGDTSASLSWNIPLTTLPGVTHARFRLTSDVLTDETGSLDPLSLGIDERAVGNATDGEVEDYPVSISVPLFDYGDAPDTSSGTTTRDYQTTENDGGPRHVVVDTIGLNFSLGNNIDGDDGSLQSENADADDLDGTNVDLLNTLLTNGSTNLNDEDGVDVENLPSLTADAGLTYTVPVTVRNNIPLLDGFVVGYIDFNQDGDFDDPGERSTTATASPVTSVSATVGTNGSSTNVSGSVDNTGLRTVNVTFTIPADVTPGNTFARFRLGSIQEIVESATSLSLNTSNGEVNNGEVEDYSIEIFEAEGNRPLGSSFTCDSTFYITIGDNGNRNDSEGWTRDPSQQLYRVNRSGSSYTFDPIGPTTEISGGYPEDFSYNALAYNPVNNYIYGYIYNSKASSGPYSRGNFVQIGSDGILHSIGKPASGTLPDSAYYAATFLSDGTYVIGAGNNFAKIDVSGSTPSVIATSSNSPSNVSFTDFAVDPSDPVSGSGAKIYGINENGSSDRLVIMDVTNLPPTVSSTASNPTGQNHNAGSQFVDSFGTLYYRSNSDRGLYQVNSDSSSPDYGKAALITTAPAGGNHDGASCLFASGMTKEVRDLEGNSIATIPAGQTVNYVYSIASGNIQDITGVTFEDDLRTVAGGNPIDGTFTGKFTISNGSGNVSFNNNNQTIQISDLIIPAQTQADGGEELIVTAEVKIARSLAAGEYFNQSSISNLPSQYPSTLVSDYPPSAAYEDPTPLQVTAPLEPNLLLIKRITAINPGRENEVTFDSFIDDGTANNQDNDPSWPDSDDTYLRGAIDIPSEEAVVKPGDEIEYTIYFLSNGDEDVNDLKICDLIPENMTFVNNSFDRGSGIALGLDDRTPATTATNLSNTVDTDEGAFYAPATVPQDVDDNSLCKKAGTEVDANGNSILVDIEATDNVNGAVVVELDSVPDVENPGNPADSYGFVRFRARVK